MEQAPTDSSQDRSYDPAKEVVQLCQDLIAIDTSNFGTDDGPGLLRLRTTAASPV